MCFLCVRHYTKPIDNNASYYYPQNGGHIVSSYSMYTARMVANLRLLSLVSGIYVLRASAIVDPTENVRPKLYMCLYG